MTLKKRISAILSSFKGETNMIVNDKEQMDAYVQEFMALAKEDGCDLNERRTRRVLLKYSFSDIERVLDACSRFGFANVVKSF